MSNGVRDDPASAVAIDDPTERPRSHPGRWIAAAVGALLLVFVGVLATRPPAADRQAQSPLLGKSAPEVSGTSIFGGSIRLSEHRGRFVLVNFVASWCVPCVQEHPELVRFTQRHRAADDAEVLSVIFDDSADNVRGLFARLGGEWPVLADTGGQVALDYGVRGPPESFLVDPDGFVISKFVGRVSADGLDALLRRARARGQAR